jgi:DNA modification methylase
MNTDPPYGVAYANDDRPNPGVAKPRVANDGLAHEKLQAFLESVFRVAVECALAEKSAWYLWHAHLTQGYFAAAAAAAAANVVLHRQIIWVKPVLLLGRGQYHWKHEPCFMGWIKGQQPPDYGEGNGERTQTTIWELKTVTQAERKEFNHSTPKPVELFAIPIVKHLKQGEICFEPFAGSFPQLIAAQQLGRRCFGMDLVPEFVDVGCMRWSKLTGSQPILESTGQTFDAVKAERLGGAVPVEAQAKSKRRAKAA